MKCHFRLRKPSFYPLNYEDDDLEGIDELNGDGQAAVACAAMSRGRDLLSTMGRLVEIIYHSRTRR
jgi:hypothetical protein